MHSLGATMEEARESAAALRLESAINLDGGGSSQLV
ncbi:MAG: phosphodiester glycosidase family protein [Synergistaceae bacterium]|nr:phosphodiester glycosidase family protein [Synergistaceae bacterium]